ncbi:MAG TPA: hypothetical protein VK986_04340 [Tepidisphaeraceae bacterium]|nr:hypothetical protein [Tepidisphaeraceae bacterium]
MAWKTGQRPAGKSMRARAGAHAVALLLCLAVGAGCDNSQELTRTDSEKEANKILVELARHGVNGATKVPVKAERKTAFGIKVPPGELNRAREVLVAVDLPRATHGGYKAMAEQGGLIPTKSEERAKLTFAISEELANTFETYDRVVAARVHVVIPEKDPLRREAAKAGATATVMIKYTGLPADPPADGAAAPPAGTATARPTDPFADSPVKALDVQQIVARSVEGLETTNVFVTFNRTVPMAAAPEGGTAATGSTGSGTGSTGGDRTLLMQVLGVAAGFGLLSIFLIVLLVREKRRQRLAAAVEAPAGEVLA